MITDTDKITITPTRLRLAVSVSSMAIFMANLDMGIVNIALPSIARVYSSDAADVAIIVQTYLLSLTAFLLIAGKLADARGAERILTQGFIIFTASSLLCGMATTLYQLAFFRFLQGIGGAFIYATAAVIVVRYVEEEKRGRAYSLNALMAGIGYALGSPLGGVLIQYLDWRWIFFINIPVGAVALIVGRYAFIREPVKGGMSDFDWRGSFYNFAFLVLFLSFMHDVGDSGIKNLRVISLLFAAGFFLVLFVARQMSCRNPLLDLSLFRNPLLRAALLANMFFMVLMGGVNLVLPFYLSLVKQLSPRDAGLFLMILPGISILLSGLSGYLSDKTGSRPVCIAGALTMSVASAGFLLFNATTSYTVIVVMLTLMGSGLALILTAMLTMIMSYAEPGREGMLASLRTLLLNLGAVIGVSIFVIAYNRPLNGLSPEAAAMPGNVARGFGHAAWLGVAVALMMLVSVLLSNSKKHE